MLIKLVLIGAVFLLAAFFLRHHGTSRASAGMKICFLLFAVFGIYGVVRPGDTSKVANLLGVGRGTDLLLYGLVVAFGFAVLHFYLRLKQMEARLARVTRAVSLRDAELRVLSLRESALHDAESRNADLRDADVRNAASGTMPQPDSRPSDAELADVVIETKPELKIPRPASGSAREHLDGATDRATLLG
jgi:hypothetical protein